MYENELKKVEEYEKYINEHCQNVELVWNKLQFYLVGEYWIDEYTYAIIDELVETHDQSKFQIEATDL